VGACVCVCLWVRVCACVFDKKTRIIDMMFVNVYGYLEALADCLVLCGHAHEHLCGWLSALCVCGCVCVRVFVGACVCVCVSYLNENYRHDVCKCIRKLGRAYV